MRRSMDETDAIFIHRRILNKNFEIKMKEYTHIIHPFEPLYNEASEKLILGSLPSVKSREQNFFYGHKQNRFWKLVAALYGENEPGYDDIQAKRALILNNHIALWDTIYSCDIIGSSDSSIKNVVPTDLKIILENSNVKHIYCNGNASGKYYERYHEKGLGIKAVTLPSTSPANAVWKLEMLVDAWKIITQ